MRNTTLLICLVLALFPMLCQAIYHEDCFINDFTNSTINQNNLLYFSGGYSFSDLRIYDLTDLNNPVMLSTTDIPGISGCTWQMALQDNIIYTTCNSDSLYLTILDVENPTQPQILSRRCFSMDPNNLIVYGQYVYLTNHDNDLNIINVSDLNNPVQINSIALGDSTQHIGEMKLKDHYLYIAMKMMMKIYDITNPEQPAFLGEYPTSQYQYQLSIGDGKAYLSGSSSDSTGIEIIDVSNPQDMHLIGAIQNASSDLFYSDNHLYICNDTRISKLDVSNTNNPIHLGFYENPLGLGISDVQNGYVYAQSLYHFLRIDMNDPSNQILAGTYAEAQIDPTSMQIQGNTAIFKVHSIYDNVVGTEYSVQILDVTQTNQIQHTSTISSLDHITPIKLVGQYAYVINYSASSLLIYDIGNPHEPALVNTLAILLEGATIRKMEVVGNRAYILSMHTLYVLDIENASNPSFLGRLTQYDYNMVDLRINDNIAYVATVDGGISMYDISNPATISAIGSFANPVENALSFFEMSGNIAYLAAKTVGVQVVNLQDPANPVLVQTIKPTNDICVTPIAKYEHYLLFGDDYRNIIYTYDISNPLQPVFYHSLIWNQMTDVLCSNNNRIYSISSTSINDLSLSGGFAPVEDQTMPIESISLSNYPNPFNPDTKLSFTLAKPSFVKLVVYNIRGQQIRTLASQSMPAGKHQISWDGKDDCGKPVASGVYFSRLETPDHKVTRKMVMVK